VLTDLLCHGLLAPSFLPLAPIRDLRALTRYHKTLAQERIDEVNRLHKTLASPENRSRRPSAHAIRHGRVLTCGPCPSGGRLLRCNGDVAAQGLELVERPAPHACPPMLIELDQHPFLVGLLFFQEMVGDARDGVPTATAAFLPQRTTSRRYWPRK